MQALTDEARLLLKRLKESDLDEISHNPTVMLKYYPVRDPDNATSIFDEAYCLLNANLLTKTYRYRVIYFFNTFLSSTKVPASIIAAYIKKLSRLSLDAKPKTLIAILKLVGNLFLRHPILFFLRDRVDDKARVLELKANRCTLREWLESDPFDPEQMRELKLSHAMESCIWELMPLRYHRHPKVAAAAAYLGQPQMLDMEEELDPGVI